MWNSGVRIISGEGSTPNGTVTFEGKNSSAGIHGIPDEYFKIKEDVPFHFGRKPNQLDVDEVRKVLVIGTMVAERLFAPGVALERLRSGQRLDFLVGFLVFFGAGASSS